MDIPDALRSLLADQDGVVARRQVVAAGWSRHDIDRMIRRREWAMVHPLVYVDHTGPLTWRQRAWAGVLACWPAALDGRSALRAHEGPGRRGADHGPIAVVVARERRFRAPLGVVVRRAARLDATVQWNLAPPRIRFDDAVLRLADTAGRELDAIAVLADACGSRRTTAARLRARLDELPRLHRRRWLAGILDDIAEGTCSVLEHGYLTLVERPHGLPRGERQAAAHGLDGRPMLRDVRYAGARPAWVQNVELDGRLGPADGGAKRTRARVAPERKSGTVEQQAHRGVTALHTSPGRGRMDA